jgi:WD40 repeat protein
VVLRGHNASVNSVAWSADGLTLVTASRDRTLRMWRIDPPIPLSRGGLQETLDGATTAVIGPDARPWTPGDGPVRPRGPARQAGPAASVPPGG